jgi:two-component system, cell cycle sensor histidine kinase and response regulator CckA
VHAPPQEDKAVCLVEDEVDISTIVRKALELGGFAVHEFNDPLKAWDYFKENGKNCTVVLSDIRMPGMSGFEFCRRVKQLRSDAPVILMTSFEINPSEFESVMPNTRADGFIQKPVTMQKLVATIRELVSDGSMKP